MITFDSAVQVRDRACRTKVEYCGIKEARRVAGRMSANYGERIVAYRCPFHEGSERHHYHVGHVISVESMDRLAQAIRVIAQTPEPVEAA